ncbi:amino acid adenylation domain-containing protein [Brevibacillus laterosporus]|nr:non-ribosomal peptide synthetase [Brevibacillus laterosporus]TPG70553.1 amino acid adenylation domain-containing protein [Brevibacillus laterosporus]
MFLHLTHPQKRIWYIEKIHSNSPLHNIGGCLKIKGHANVDLLEKAIQTVIERNEGLRLRFCEREGQPYQYVNEYTEKKIDYLDFSREENPSLVFEEWVEAVFKKSFTIENHDLCYFAVYKLHEAEYGILLKVHHIISDGWSTCLIQKQLCEMYSLLQHNEQLNAGVAYSYVDYIEKEKAYFHSERFQKNKIFWNETFSDVPEAFLYKSFSHLESRRKSYEMTADMTDQIRSFLQEYSISLHTFFMAVMLIYINKITDHDDIVLGTPVLNRTDKRDKNTVGMYTSTMPFRKKINPELSVKEFIKEVVYELKRCLINQKYPYDLLVSDLGLNKKGYDSLFKLCINYYNTEYLKDVEGVMLEVDEYNSGNQSYSMQVIVKEWRDDTISLCFDFKVDEYNDEDISSMFKHTTNVAEQMIKNMEMKIKDLHVCTIEELHEKVYTFNSTRTNYPKDKTIHGLFEEQAELTPDKVALVFGEQQVTYRQLDEKASQLAAFLRGKGVQQQRIVAIQATHSIELIVGILGVLKTGAAYLPIEPNYPSERINYMLKDSGAFIMLTNHELADEIDFSGEIYHFVHDEIYLDSQNNTSDMSSPHDLAYMIYTSGSTGQPKGVMIEHNSLVNYIWWARKTYVEENEIFALYSSISFDLTVTSIFTPLLSGHQIAIYQDNGEDFILHKVFNDNKATIVKVTPAHLTLIKDLDNKNSSIQKFIVGGENLKVAIAKQVEESFNGQIEIYNEYGPTEATVGCMIYKYASDKDTGVSVPIGSAIDNTQIYILDKYLQPVPTGIKGEIYISGDGVAKGYLNREELTNERFIDHPFLSGKKMYKTGDVAKYISDSIIEYVGRSDNQVKIRGHRIELGEIERYLLEHSMIKNVIVIDRENAKGDKLLYAYFVSDEEIDGAELKKWLSTYVPSFMIPNRMIKLEQLPLTINGKLNMHELPFDDESELEMISPRNEREEQLVKVMGEVLGIAEISMNDNFYQIGGDSIKAIQISSKLKNMNMELHIKDILEKELVEEIAATIKENHTQKIIDQGVSTGTINQTPIIQWFFSQQFEQENHFNQSVLLACKKSIDKQIIATAIKKLVEHHDMLRVRCDRNTKELFYQNDHIHETDYFVYYDLTHEPEEMKFEKMKELGSITKSSFHLEETPLFKACIFQLGEEEQYLLFTAHHIVVDGVSWRILIEDFTSGVEQLQHHQEISLPLKTHSFGEWARQLATYSLHVTQTDQALRYWKDTTIQSFQFPTDFDRGIDDVKSSSTMQAYLDGAWIKDFSVLINDVYGLELYEGLLIGLLVTVHQSAKEQDIVIELEGHGRETIHDEIDISRTVGWFTSMYPANFSITDMGLEHIIKHVKEQIRAIPHKGFTYGVLKYLTKELQEEIGKGIRFNYLGHFDNVLQGDFTMADLDCGADIGSNNHLTALLDINVWIANGQLQINVTYSANRFREETIQQFLNEYLDSLNEIRNYCFQKNDKEFTPSDFETADISQDDLDGLFI